MQHGNGKYVTHTGRVYEGRFENDHIADQFNLFENGKEIQKIYI